MAAAGTSRTDAIVVGSGPNGLAAAITLARAGVGVRVLEAADTIGGGTRTSELTLPGFRHDVCSAIHPLAVGSPFFRSLGLEEHGLEWIHPDVPLAHPLDDAPPVLLDRSLAATADTLGVDGEAYRGLVGTLASEWDAIAEAILGPPGWPSSPLSVARFGLRAVRSAVGLAHSRFHGGRARALFAGLAGHSMLELDRAGSAGVGLVLALAGHAVGWPFPRGGSERIGAALATRLERLGGEIETGREVDSLDRVGHARAVLLDVTPRQLLRIAGRRLSAGYRRRLAAWRYGPGAYKVDWALAEPIPWRDPACARAGTVHLGGTLEEIAAAEGEVWRGRLPERPFVLLAQQSLFDPGRAPGGRHTAWAYAHVPHGSDVDATDHVERQVERFAPGFRDVVLERHTMSPVDLEAYNPNYVGGDINGGVQDLVQSFARPVAKLTPYDVPLEGVYLCSSSTPPGGGVHGMCGYRAARVALERTFGVESPEKEGRADRP
ncbi:MAG: NAD(P)/FAD-dependent oxidoreductase [Gemmatimonadota bacterium]|nr:NAD(P)/FAD-dependent oxidoreductase [Gemmatimonadota bacterium]